MVGRIDIWFLKSKGIFHWNCNLLLYFRKTTRSNYWGSTWQWKRSRKRRRRERRKCWKNNLITITAGNLFMECHGQSLQVKKVSKIFIFLTPFYHRPISTCPFFIISYSNQLCWSKQRHCQLHSFFCELWQYGLLVQTHSIQTKCWGHKNDCPGSI